MNNFIISILMPILLRYLLFISSFEKEEDEDGRLVEVRWIA